MDERLRVCLWMVGGGAFGGVLGGVFGALAAVLHARSGSAAGTRLARNVVENFLQAGDRQPSPTFHAAIIGAADGFFFVGGLGLVGGALLGKSGRTADELLLPMVVGTVLLVGGAILFGSMAYALQYRAAEFLYISASTSLCGILGSILLGPDYSFYGLGFGVGAGWMIGLALCRAVRAYSPKFHPPRIDKPMPQSHSHVETDSTGPPPTPQNDDFFRQTE